ncbi:hypothetical protein EVAR_32193_1 [Eumeta japonica]|uniref:Uncharacterized protein n=1 Tax=Eumeta variegata TaxID=151549 RepID=A0A4C1W0L2_EUMVA|nr:hypothetical protein EVAR_32193_1 [Eumeta japonica]
MGGRFEEGSRPIMVTYSKTEKRMESLRGETADVRQGNFLNATFLNVQACGVRCSVESEVILCDSLMTSSYTQLQALTSAISSAKTWCAVTPALAALYAGDLDCFRMVGHTSACYYIKSIQCKYCKALPFSPQRWRYKDWEVDDDCRHLSGDDERDLNVMLKRFNVIFDIWRKPVGQQTTEDPEKQLHDLPYDLTFYVQGMSNLDQRQYLSFSGVVAI